MLHVVYYGGEMFPRYGGGCETRKALFHASRLVNWYTQEPPSDQANTS